MRREKIKYPVLVPLGLAILVLLSASIMGLYRLQRQHIHEEVRASVAGVQDLFQAGLEGEAKLMNGLMELVRRDENLQKAWLAKDRDALLAHSTPLFEDICSKYHVTHFYFHDLDKVCFLRVHNPPRYGDYIERFTLDGAMRKGESFHGIELGPFGTFTLRAVHPWRVDGKLAAYIELGMEVGHVTIKKEDKETLGVEFFFIVDKSYLDRARWEEGMKMIGHKGDWDQFPNFVIVSQTMPQVSPELNEYLKQLISCSEAEHFRGTVKMSSGDRTYQGGFVPLLDAGGRDIGDLIVINDITSKQAALRTQLIILIVICAVTAMALFVFFYWYVGRIEQRLLEAHEAMTAKIEEQKKDELLLRKDDEKLQKEVVQRTNAEARLEKQVVELEQAREAALNMMEDIECEINERKKTEQNLQAAQKKLIDTARQVGMAETATDVLHNVGNVLNSVSVTTASIRKRVHDSKVSYLTEVVGLLEEHADDLSTFMTTEEGGRKLPAFLANLSKELIAEQERSLKALETLTKHVEHMAEIIQLQQSYSKTTSMVESASVIELVEDAIRINAEALIRHGVEVKREFVDLPPVLLDHHKVLQILTNLISNAKYALSDSGRDGKILTICVREPQGGHFRIEVHDNGIGITEENLARIFEHGFTTKKHGYGFGLHSAAIAANEMNGSLTAHSDGPGKGTAFILELPFQTQEIAK